MTAYALHFRPGEVVIASDTLIYSALGEPMSFRDKVLPLPRLKAAFFSRGADTIGINAIATVALRYDLVTLEDVAAALPDILREVTERMADEAGIVDPDQLLLFEGRLLGWSAAENKFALWFFNNYEGYAPKRMSDQEIRAVIGGASGFMVSPPLPPQEQLPLRGVTPERGLLALMQAHRRRGETIEGCAKIGGEVIFTTLTPAGVSTRTVHRFADYDSDAHAGAAVTARMDRGERPIDLNQAITHVADAVDGRQLTATPAAEGGATVANLSRQQRRQLEREQRRAKRRDRDFLAVHRRDELGNALLDDKACLARTLGI